jgi:small subunit ribosomal protein S27Ae
MITSMMLKNLLNNVKVNKRNRVWIEWISAFLGIPVDEQRLTLGGISLDDELTLEECHVEEESTLYVLLDLEGGGKKRKKKSYNTPKKNKHKHKKVKLAVLKYYKVN